MSTARSVPGLFFASLLSLILAACAGSRPDEQYLRVAVDISADSIAAIQKKIRQISDDSFEARQFAVDQMTLPYRILLPPPSAGKVPLVLILHGSGAVGTDNFSQLGLPARYWAQATVRKKYPAVVVAPQFPVRSSNYAPDSTRNVLTSVPDPVLSLALMLVDSLKEVLPVNPDKIYVIGFSMGGSSAINSLSLRPDLFAAAVSISGIPSFRDAATLQQTPVWLIHGNADTENPFASDSLFYREQAPHHQKLRFWEIEGMDHEIYYRLYASSILPEWLWEQEKAQRE